MTPLLRTTADVARDGPRGTVRAVAGHPSGAPHAGAVATGPAPVAAPLTAARGFRPGCALHHTVRRAQTARTRPTHHRRRATP